MMNPSDSPNSSASPSSENASGSAAMHHGYPVQDISRYMWLAGGKEKDLYRISRKQAAAVSKNGDLRRIQEEVKTLRALRKYGAPTITCGDVQMFRRGDRVSPGFIVDWVEHSLDSNANPVRFEAALRQLRADQRVLATRDLDKIESVIRTHGGVLDLQVLLDPLGHLRVLDPRGKILETAGSFIMIQRWRTALQPLQNRR